LISTLRRRREEIVNTAIEIHDSTIAEVIELNGTVFVHFQRAYLHKSEGQPAFDAGTGWVQEARLFFSEASVSGDFPDWPCDVTGGEIVVDGERHNNLIPVPLETSKPTEMRLVCNSIHTVTIPSCGVRLELVGEPKFVEEFRPQK
jgi:hypothetical protein